MFSTEFGGSSFYSKYHDLHHAFTLDCGGVVTRLSHFANALTFQVKLERGLTYASASELSSGGFCKVSVHTFKTLVR